MEWAAGSGYLTHMPAKLRQAAVSVLKGETALWPALAAGIVVAVASYCVGPTRGDLEVDVALASMATFLFGVLIAFTIARTTERLAVVQNLVSRNNASLLSILQLMAVFDATKTDAVRQMIDHQLTDQIDYRLVDNHLATPSNLALTAAIIELDPQTLQQEQAYRSLLDVCIDITANRAQIESTTGQSLQPIEWIGLLLLLLILMSLIVVLPGGTLWGALIAGALAGTLVTLVVLLRKLDLLRWHEVSSIWEPTHAAVPEHGPAPLRAAASHHRRALPAFRGGPGGRLPRPLPQPVDEDRHARRSLSGRARGRCHGCGGRSRRRRVRND